MRTHHQKSISLLFIFIFVATNRFSVFNFRNDAKIKWNLLPPSLLFWLSIGFKCDRIGKTNLLKFCEDIYIILKEFWFSTSTQCQFSVRRVKKFPFFGKSFPFKYEKARNGGDERNVRESWWRVTSKKQG